MIFKLSQKKKIELNILRIQKNLKNFIDLKIFMILLIKIKKFKYILNWYKNYLPLINFNNKTKYKLIWESYTISYRIINTINFQKIII